MVSTQQQTERWSLITLVIPFKTTHLWSQCDTSSNTGKGWGAADWTLVTNNTGDSLLNHSPVISVWYFQQQRKGLLCMTEAMHTSPFRSVERKTRFCQEALLTLGESWRRYVCRLLCSGTKMWLCTSITTCHSHDTILLYMYLVMLGTCPRAAAGIART